MVKNIFIKKVLKYTIFKPITIFNRLIKKQENIILLYMGNKGIGYNLEPLLDYLLEKKYNKNYKIICSVENKSYYGELLENVKYIGHKQAIFWYLKSKHVFYTAGQLPIKPSNEQIVIHLNHGIADYKTAGALTKINNGDEFFFTYILASSPLYIPIIKKEYVCKAENIFVSSEPMTDRLFKPKTIYDFSSYSKVLLWVPTFRKSDYLGYDDSSEEELVPLFSSENYGTLNHYLEDNNILLIVKIHPSQSIRKDCTSIYSNFKIFSHYDFERENYNLYDLMAQVDGLIGDYSSASLQFLLTNKPLAYVIPDFEEYKNRRGFVFDDPIAYMPGHIILKRSDFFDFLEDFSKGIDKFKNQRIQVKNRIHTFQSGDSCERIIKISEIFNE